MEKVLYFGEINRRTKNPQVPRMAMKNFVSASCLILLIGLGAWSSSSASDQLFDSKDPNKKPLSVPISQLENRINNDPSADGIILSITKKEDGLRLDLISIPGSTSVAAVTRVVFMIGRLAEPDYAEMLFVDGDVDLYMIDGEKIREIGREFVWGEEGKGQNPIHLIRLFTDNLRTPDGKRVAPPFTGSLLGDTSKAITTMNNDFNKNWVIKTAEIQ